MQHNPDLLLKVNTSCYNLTLKTYAKLKKKHEFYTYILRYERKSSDQIHSNHIFLTYTFFDSVV